MTAAVPAGSVLLDAGDTAFCAWLARDAIRGLRVAGRPVPARLAELAAVLTAAAGATASPVRGDTTTPAASTPATATEEVTVADAAARLDLSPSRVRQLVAAGELPARRAGRRVLLVDATALTALATARATAPEGD